MKNLRRSILLLSVVSVLLALPALAAAATPSITTGVDHACAVSDTGSAYCWGANDLGQLGTGNTTESWAPDAVVGLPAAVSSIYGGDKSTCALLVDATVWCWGSNQVGEHANGTFDLSPIAHSTPEKVAALSGVTQLSGSKTTYCALLADATARCWGENGYGEIGNGGAPLLASTPTSPTGLTGVRNIAAGYAHTCAILIDGTGKCWGYNAGGILGDGTNDPSTTPVTVLNLTGAISARLSGYSSCAIKQSGGAQCWGSGNMLGNDATMPSSQPVDVSNVAGVFALGGSNSNNCAITAPNQLKCWGSIPGNGSSDYAGTPVEVTNGSEAIAVSGNGFNGNVCFVSRGGGTRCWGSSNQHGQLGNGTTSVAQTTTPVAVVGLDLVKGSYPATNVTFARAGKTLLDKKKKTYTQLATLHAGIPALLGQLDACSGSVSGTVNYSYKTYKRVRGKLKSKTTKKTAKTSATLNAMGWDCVSNLTFKLPVKYLNHKSVKLNASWPGNASLTAFSASAAKFTLPKVKVAKKKSK